jgi:hypothetical protein
MKCFAAHYLYSGHGRLLTRQVICLGDTGCIQSIQPLKEETATTIFLNGLLCSAFGLPDSDQLLSPDEAVSLFSKIGNEQPFIQINNLLEFYTNDPELKVGAKPILWCIDSFDLKKLILNKETSVYSVLS